MQTEGATAQPLGFGHVADEDGLGFGVGLCSLAELVEKLGEFFGIFVHEKAEVFVGFDSHSVTPVVKGGPLSASLGSGVDGYKWTAKLWRDSLQFTLPEALSNQLAADRAYDRPVRIVKLARNAAPLTKYGEWGLDDVKDFTWLFAPNCEWIEVASSNSPMRSRI